MQSTPSPTVRAALAGLALVPFLLFACADNGNTGPDDVEPIVTITGVEDGQSYAAGVTITIQVAPGSYTATLNGAPFVSGQSVTQPGDYTLIVTGRNGLATTVEQVDFTIEAFGTGDVLIIRMFDLREGTFGAPGDAILITDSSSAGQFHALIDAGGRTVANVLSESYVRTRLEALGVDTLDFMQLTHAHADHYIGMDEILNSSIHVQDFVYNGQDRPSASSYVSLIDVAEVQADSVIELGALRTTQLGGGSVATTITMVPPHPDYDGLMGSDGDSINEGSIGTLVVHGGFRMYFTGDGQFEANERWRLSFAGLSGDVDILKIGHHAANDATDMQWLSHSSFEVAAVSANGTSHPRIAALDRLETVSNVIYCTNVHGEIRITVDEGGGYVVTTEKGVGQACVPGSAATT